MTMQKITEVKNDLLAEFERLELRKPSLSWRFNPSLLAEEFHTFYAGGILRIDAGSDSALLLALQQVVTGLLSGHFAEFLGEFNPRFPLRPLKLPPGPYPKEWGSRILRLGYNAVIVEGSEFSCFLEYGLKVFVSGNDLSQLKGADGIFWESSLLNPEFFLHPKAKEMTIAELVQEEMKKIEKEAKGKGVIYYIPAADEMVALQQASWLETLCDEAGNQTFISFPAVCGNPVYDHLKPHPFWEVLRRAPDVSSTPLMPIINIGAVCQGEGLWPSFSFDLMQERFDRHHFGGIIGLCNEVPEKKGLLHLNLWVASMWMRHGGILKGLPKRGFWLIVPILTTQNTPFFSKKSGL